jgi:KUP system potassium uptake protein
MEQKNNHTDIRKLSLAGVIVTMGIVFGDLGTSPLYTMRSVMMGSKDGINELLIYGSLSCIFWTLTLSTTIKYVIITLRADNNGEGGIFALFALIRRKSTWAAILCMIGGSALLADGVITPSITVTSAVEGLRMINPEIPVVPIVLIILAVMFFIQQFGTDRVGSSFGPIMLIWFLSLGVLGIDHIREHPGILAAVNPAYAFRFLSEFPGGFILLGAVFLCTTGAEALYADLGHCGRTNIRISWAFVKICLLLNYFGQGAWLMVHYTPGMEINPFFELMPKWLILPGVIIATAAAIIASQAIISGSFTLISEAVSLNFWPWIRILHPTFVRGQVYIPFVNWLLWFACSGVVIAFRESNNMSAAYGLAITITEIMTTLLLSYYLYQRGVNHRLVLLLLMVYLTIEGSFLTANLYKFKYGGWFTFLLATVYFIVMYGWYFGRKIKNRYVTFSNLNNYITLFRDLATDESVPKTATDLVYIISANRIDQVESKVIYSIFHRQPKRADRYWFVHVDRVNEPNRFEYHVTQIIPGILTRIDFHIGFKVEPRINLYFREVLDVLTRNGEVSLDSGYESLKKYHVPSDFRFILIERIIPRDITLATRENMTMSLHTLLSRLSITDLISLQLDSTNTVTEQVPIIIDQPDYSRIKRINL